MKTLFAKRNPFFPVRGALAVLGALLLGAGMAGANAATVVTWNNTGGDFSWGTAGNWTSGIPTSSSIALFDTLGGGTITLPGTEAASSIQFGQASETGASTAASYILGAGTIDLSLVAGSNAAGAATVVNYAGSANTATQTIDSNLVLDFGVTNATANWYQISDTSGGNLAINGSITSQNTTGLNLVFNAAAGRTISLGGSNDFNVTVATGSNSTINVGSTATSAGGNVSIMANLALGPNTVDQPRIVVWGTQGALQLDTAASGASINYQNFIFLNNGRNSESAPQLENVSGNNNIGTHLGLSNNGNDAGTQAAPTSYYIESDAGFLTVGGVLDSQVQQTSPTVHYQALYLYGNGDGAVTGVIGERKTGNVLSLIKDGAGTWTLSMGTGNTYLGGTTVAGGTLRLDNTSNSATGSGTVLVDSTLGSGNAVLAGKGIVSGAVIVSGGGTIHPGDGGLTSANIGTLSLLSGATFGSAGSTTGTLLIDLDSDIAPVSGLGKADLLAVTGALNLSNALLSLNDLGSTALAAGTTFELASYTTLSGTFGNIGSTFTVGNNTYQLDYDDVIGGKNYITAEVVPEPGTYALLGIGIGLLFLRVNSLRRKLD